MTVETANALCRYFETLYGLNQKLFVLCGADVYDRASEYEQLIDEVVMSVPRLVPYSFNKKTSTYEITQADGLMKFSNDIPFLSKDYEDILQKHKDCLEKVKTVRNKLEHEMHGAEIVASSSGNISFYFVIYSISEQRIKLGVLEIIDFVKDMNILFSKLQKLAKQFAYDNKYNDHPYFRRLSRFDFADFNRIFESDLLYFFGKALQPF